MRSSNVQIQKEHVDIRYLVLQRPIQERPLSFVDRVGKPRWKNSFFYSSQCLCRTSKELSDELVESQSAVDSSSIQTHPRIQNHLLFGIPLQDELLRNDAQNERILAIGKPGTNGLTAIYRYGIPTGDRSGHIQSESKRRKTHLLLFPGVCQR